MQMGYICGQGKAIAMGMVLYKEQQDRAVRAVTNAAATIRGLWLQAVSGWPTREQATLIVVVVVNRSSHKEPKVN